MHLPRSLTAAVVGLVAVLALAGCGKITNSYGNAASSGAGSAGAGTPTAAASASGGGTAPAMGHTVAIQNYAFTPQKLTVKAGTKVTWTNHDTVIHDVTSTNGPGIGATTTSLFGSGSLGGGQSFSYTFTKPGTYYYECTIHAALASMHGVVIVK